MLYDDETQFKDHNTTLYLAELEEYIAMLITYTAYSQELPDAAVSALSLDKMIPKGDMDGAALNVRMFFFITKRSMCRMPTTLNGSKLTRQRLMMMKLSKTLCALMAGTCSASLRSSSPKTSLGSEASTSKRTSLTRVVDLGQTAARR